MKTKRLEKITKGFANERRIAILQLLTRHRDLDVAEIADRLKYGYTSTAMHLQKMYDAGLISKEEDGYFVLHRLTSRGRKIAAFLQRLY